MIVKLQLDQLKIDSNDWSIFILLDFILVKVQAKNSVL